MGREGLHLQRSAKAHLHVIVYPNLASDPDRSCLGAFQPALSPPRWARSDGHLELPTGPSGWWTQGLNGEMGTKLWTWALPHTSEVPWNCPISLNPGRLQTKGVIKGALTAAPRLPPHWALPIYKYRLALLLTQRSGHRRANVAGSTAAEWFVAAAPAVPAVSGSSCRSGGSGCGEKR